MEKVIAKKKHSAGVLIFTFRNTMKVYINVSVMRSTAK